MPTVIIKCNPDWYPKEETFLINGGIDAIAGWLPEAVAEALNEVDGRGEGIHAAIPPEEVYVDFAHIDAWARNAADVLILVHPPEINADFDSRQVRRAELRRAIKDGLWSRMLTQCDRLAYPSNWEVEVIPVESSGYRLNGRGEVVDSWGDAPTKEA